LLEFIVGIKFKENDILTFIYWELHSQLDVLLSLSFFYLIFFNFHVGFLWKQAKREKTKGGNANWKGKNRKCERMCETTVQYFWLPMAT